MFDECSSLAICAEDTVARSILHVYLLLTVIYAADGQSSAADPRCVYTFNVPASECGQTPGSSVDDQVWKNSVIAMQAQVHQLASVTSKLTNDNRKLARVVESLQRELANSNTGMTKMFSPGPAVETFFVGSIHMVPSLANISLF